MSQFKIRNLRWWMIGLIMVGSMINYLARNTLGVSAKTLQDSLHFGDAEYSTILNVFQAAIIMQPICGYVLDVIGLKRGFAIFAGIWSLANIGHAWARGWHALAVLRGIMGFSEGAANPGGMKAVAEWFPAVERGFASGVFNIGASVGSLAAVPLVGWAIARHNWQTAFAITGGIGLVWVVIWLFGYQSPAKHPALSNEERDYIAAGQEQHLSGTEARPSIWAILGRRNFWGIALPRLLADPMWATLTNWMPLYLAKERGWDLKHIALFAWLPFLAADLGCLFGGTVVAFLQKRGVNLINARRGAFTVGVFLMISMLFVGFVPNAYAAIALLSLGGFAHQTLSVTVITMSSDLFKRSEVATVAGLAGTCGNTGVLIYNYLYGHFARSIGYAPLFMGVLLLDCCGAAILWTFVREERKNR